jgi:hypothetical protein
MKAATIKLKTYANTANVAKENFQGIFVKGVLWYGGMLAVLYVLFLGSMVFNIVERKALDADARDLSNEVGSLELEYLSLSSKIDLNYSYSLGFREAKTKFATRKSLGAKLLVNNEI